MNPKEILRLAVRLLGLVFLYHGLVILPAALDQAIGAFPHQVGLHSRTTMDFGAVFGAFLLIGWPLGVAYWLLRGAPLVMCIAYPESHDQIGRRSEGESAVEPQKTG